MFGNCRSVKFISKDLERGLFYATIFCMQIPKRRLEKLVVRDNSPIPITKEGLAELKEKLERLKAAIPHLAGEAKRTADYGDRSENAEYKDAKGKLRGTHRQILNLENQIKRATVIRLGSGFAGKIQLGSTVDLESNGKKLTFQIVGPQETNPDKGRISHKSPLGSALLGHKKGDSVNIKTTAGQLEYTILDVR